MHFCSVCDAQSVNTIKLFPLCDFIRIRCVKWISLDSAVGACKVTSSWGFNSSCSFSRLVSTCHRFAGTQHWVRVNFRYLTPVCVVSRSLTEPKINIKLSPQSTLREETFKLSAVNHLLISYLFFIYIFVVEALARRKAREIEYSLRRQ